MKKALAIFGTLLCLLYPLLVYFSLHRMPVSVLAYTLIGIAIIRFITAKKRISTLLQVLALLLFAILLLIKGETHYLRFYPVFINLGMLILFSVSLIWPPSLIEQFARISEPNLPESGIKYTRKVTQVWCIFFIVNGAIAFWTALYADWALWTLYNGLIAYLLMGALFVGEWLVRQQVRHTP